MIYPIFAYGQPVLRKKCAPIDQDYPDLKQLIADMFETMYDSSGVGLAAPQIGLPIRLFVIDTTPFSEDEENEVPAIKKTFINPTILDESGKEWKFQEGCLSIPGVREDVSRKGDIKIHYFDENWKEHTQTFDDLVARVIQHEYDHIEGILFTDKLSSLKKKLLKKKLNNISKGIVDVEYRMKFVK